MLINSNFEKLPESYLFSRVASALRDYEKSHPSAEVIRMDIGDVTLPVAPCVVEAMRRAVDEMGKKETFHGYGPEQGYDFLREAISINDYKNLGIEISADEIFISDGAKSDLGNLGDIYSYKCVVAVCDPGYPVYADSTVIDGRGGAALPDGRWSRILYIECPAEKGFIPQIPKMRADVIYICSPCNPTGVCLSRENLEKWVDYARRNKSLIIYDSAYEAFVRDPELPRSIYEIDGAREVAIEVRSFSKTAGFTGLRCGYTVVPSELYGEDEEGRAVSLRKLWLRRQTTKFNGASYIVQRGAEALYSTDGRKYVESSIYLYLENARYIREAMQDAGFKVYGGENSPYVWARLPEENDSWVLFHRILENAQVSVTPGVGFGLAGAGYVRLTGFNSRENTIAAMERIRMMTERDRTVDSFLKTIEDTMPEAGRN